MEFATSVFINSFIATPPDIDGIREPVFGSLLYKKQHHCPFNMEQAI